MTAPESWGVERPSTNIASELAAVDRAALRGLRARVEATEDDWGVSIAVDTYLRGDWRHWPSTAAFLAAVAKDVWWHLGHVGAADDGDPECHYHADRTDRESARIAERSVRRAARWLAWARERIGAS